MKDIQISKILRYMRTHDGITQQDCYQNNMGTRLPARISDLEKRGYDFDRSWERSENSRYMRYRLKEEENDNTGKIAEGTERA